MDQVVVAEKRRVKKEPVVKKDDVEGNAQRKRDVKDVNSSLFFYILPN